MKLNALTLLVCVSCVYAGGDKELTQHAPTVGQALMTVLKKKFFSKQTLHAKLKQQQGNPARTRNLAFDDAQQLLRPGHYNFSHDVV